MRKFLAFLGWYIVLSCAAALGWLLSGASRPETPVGWVVAFLLALPATLVVEALGDVLLSRNPIAKAVDRRTRDKEFSWLRIGYALAAVLTAIGVALWIAAFFS